MYVGPGEGGDQLWVRERDRLDATPLPGTLGAVRPCFSPDGQRIGFSASLNLQLKVVPVTGGPPITLATPGAAALAAAGPGGRTAGSTSTHPAASAGSRPTVARLSWSIPLDTIAATRSGMPGPRRCPNGKGLLYRSRRNLGPDGLRHRRVRLQDARAARPDQGPAGAVRRAGIPGLPAGRRGGPRGAVRPGQVQADGARRAALRRGHDEALRLGAISPSRPRARWPTCRGWPRAPAASRKWCTSAGRAASRRSIRRSPSTLRPIASLSLSPDGTRVALDVIGAASPDIWIKQLPVRLRSPA